MISPARLEAHRVQCPVDEPVFIDFRQPFSCFDFIEERFGAPAPTIHRCFSIARSKKCESFSFEKIEAIGLLASENEELAQRGWSSSKTICRMVFFKSRVLSNSDLQTCPAEDIVGYAIVKIDGPDAASGRPYIFESVFVKYDHPHNYVRHPTEYAFRVGSRLCSIRGVMYCQQNGCNKVCAHVALRSLISRAVPERDVEYAVINSIAAKAYPNETYDPANGLDALQIKAVLQHYGLKPDGIDYLNTSGGHEDSFHRDFPFQKYLYSGLESGFGALLGFKTGALGHESRHIIPVFGHTFNKDTWVSDAEAFYFQLGKGLGYIPSETWTSSFISHDDNFGSNFCIPRLYLNPSQVDYAAGIFPAHIELMPTDADAVAVGLLPELIPYLDCGNKWQRRLAEAFQFTRQDYKPRIVVRSLLMSSADYLRQVADSADWDRNAESRELVEAFSQVTWADEVWVVEVSLPQLFPTNEAKLGEIILNAKICPSFEEQPPGLSAFLFARLPGAYFFKDVAHGNGGMGFIRLRSRLVSHIPVFH